MTGGLVQDYSKSPIKTAHAGQNAQSVPDIPPSQPDPLAQQQITNPYASYQQSSGVNSQAAAALNISATPPKRSMDASRPVAARLPQPMGQQHDSPVLPVPDRASQSNDAYTPPTIDHSATTETYAQTPHSYTQGGFGGYRQNPIHDGGSTDYGNAEGESGLEYAERTWKSATHAVSEYTSSAGEVAGNALDNLKGWLNPESKGLR